MSMWLVAYLVVCLFACFFEHVTNIYFLNIYIYTYNSNFEYTKTQKIVRCISHLFPFKTTQMQRLCTF